MEPTAALLAHPTVVCVGDLHGNLREARLAWANLERRLGGPAALLATPVVFLGDYVDRGPQSKQVRWRRCWCCWCC